MTNDAQREVWSAADVAETWPKTEAISDQGTPLLMEALRLQPGERVLDVACGGGKTTMAAARAVGPSGHVTGVDISKGMLELAKQRLAEAGLSQVELVLCDAQVDPFPSGPFDAALSQFGIMFFDDPKAALGNIRSHLKPGGRVAFVVWQPEDRMAWSPAHVIIPFLPPPEEGAENTIERAGSGLRHGGTDRGRLHGCRGGGAEPGHRPAGRHRYSCVAANGCRGSSPPRCRTGGVAKLYGSAS